MTTFHKSSIDTDHFCFTGYGETEKKAISALKMAVKNHCAQYDTNTSRFWEHYTVRDIYTVELAIGGGYRDDHPMLDNPVDDA